MVGKMSEILKNKFDYELKDYATFEISRGRSKILYVFFGIFGVSILLYVLRMFGIWENFMSLGLLLGLLFLLVVVPLAFQKNEYEAIVVTPKYILQRIAKKEFIVIEFDKISDFHVSNAGMVIKEGKKQIILSTDLFKEEVEPIIEILEAKGKTFDSKKDFMIRKITIRIADNKVFIEDDEKETSTEKIYVKYQKDFPVLTPGFIDEVMFRNSMVDDVLHEGDDVSLYLATLEVKLGHPENTTFENIHASDCILIFEGLKFQKATMEDLNSKERKMIELDIDLENVIEHLPKSVISEWKNKGKMMQMTFAAGVNLFHTTFTYEEVIIGWKESK